MHEGGIMKKKGENRDGWELWYLWSVESWTILVEDFSF
jgi:hypothetical protein